MARLNTRLEVLEHSSIGRLGRAIATGNFSALTDDEIASLLPVQGQLRPRQARVWSRYCQLLKEVTNADLNAILHSELAHIRNAEFRGCIDKIGKWSSPAPQLGEPKKVRGRRQ
jgi:hypothetical protein